MRNWTDENKDRVSQYLCGAPCKFIGVDVFNEKASPFSSYEISEVELILGYDDFYHLYVAWNPYVHDWHSGEKVTLSCKIGKTKIYEKKFSAFLPIYRQIRGGKTYEKIVIIREGFIKDFCEHYREYLMPHPEEEGFNEGVVYADEDDPTVRLWKEHKKGMCNTERRYITCNKLERNASFRKKCLQAYDTRCVICGCRTELILQAAHIIPVKYGGNDDADNGVCLCANHHLMYDKHLLTINWEDGTFQCDCPTEETMPWYIAARENGFKLYYESSERQEA